MPKKILDSLEEDGSARNQGAVLRNYPLVFSYRDVIPGGGFVAVVEIHGRALLEEGLEESWMRGLNPGGIAGGGNTRDEAIADFRNGYTSVLMDIAHAASDFCEFKAETERFFYNAYEALEKEWQAAIAAVRSGELKADWLRKHPFSTDQLHVGVMNLRPERAMAEDSLLPVAELAA